jgi:ArsR family transcriptional regulator, arsenate/arsenite/antimonite-responsive transcriptional repressor
MLQAYSRIFKAVSDVTRLRILALIFELGALCVCEVEQLLGITQSKASRHLRYLRDAGILEDRREGLMVNYGLPALPDPELSVMLIVLSGILRAEPLPDARARLSEIRALRSEAGAVAQVVASTSSLAFVQPAFVQPAPVQPAPVQPAFVQPAPVQPAPVRRACASRLRAAKGEDGRA